MPPEEPTRAPLPVKETAPGLQLSGIYELDERIASGGMGEVYRGHNIQTGDHVAIKIVLPELAQDPTILSLFRKEASVLNHLSHDAIVRYHVFTVDAGIGRPYLAMEFVNGPSLADIMQDGPMPASQAQKLLLRLASGLGAAHEHGVIHRDLSPDNIILPGGKVERAKIIDFGIARSAQVGGQTLLGGQFAGKYNYVSPEQLGLFGREITEGSDVYSLGLVLAAALRGTPLDMAGSQLDVIEKRRSVPDLSGIDARLRPVLEAMLRPIPADRLSSMTAVLDRLSEPGPAAAIERTSIGRPDATQRESARPPRFDAVDGRTQVSSHPTGIPSAPPGRSPSFSSFPTRDDAGGPSGPVSESPFGPYVPPAEPSLASGASLRSDGARKRSGGSGRYVAALALCLVLAGLGGLYLADPLGLFGAPPRVGDREPGSASPSTPPPSPNTRPATEEPPEQDAKTPLPAGPGTADPEAGGRSSPETAPAAPKDTAIADGNAASGTNKSPPEHPSPPGDVTAPATSDPPSGETPTETASARPPESPTEPLDVVAERLAWLSAYSGGDCFYSVPLGATQDSIEIEGFGSDVAPFNRLSKAFTAKFGIDPKIGARIVEPAQCAAVDLLSASDAIDHDPPILTLERTVLANGSTVRGRLEKIKGRKIALVLVDNDGSVHDLSARLTADGEDFVFDFPIRFTAADLARNPEAPQLVLAIATRDGIETADLKDSSTASQIMPRILSAMREDAADGAATAKLFRLNH